MAPPELLACAAQLVEEAMWDETSGIANNEARMLERCLCTSYFVPLLHRAGAHLLPQPMS